MRKGKALKYYLGFIAGLILFVKFAVAQQGIARVRPDSLVSLIKFRVSWHTGPEWEKKISKVSVIDFFGGAVVTLAADGFSLSNYFKTRSQISPDAYLEYRNYYNLFRRINNEKKTKHNSANFLFGRVEIIFPVKNQNYYNLLFVEGWGGQRSLFKKINVDFHLAIIEHFYYDKPPDGGFNYLKFEPIGQLGFSYIF